MFRENKLYNKSLLSIQDYFLQNRCTDVSHFSESTEPVITAQITVPNVRVCELVLPQERLESAACINSVIFFTWLQQVI